MTRDGNIVMVGGVAKHNSRLWIDPLAEAPLLLHLHPGWRSIYKTDWKVENRHVLRSAEWLVGCGWLEEATTKLAVTGQRMGKFAERLLINQRVWFYTERRTVTSFTDWRHRLKVLTDSELIGRRRRWCGNERGTVYQNCQHKGGAGEEGIPRWWIIFLFAAYYLKSAQHIAWPKTFKDDALHWRWWMWTALKARYIIFGKLIRGIRSCKWCGWGTNYYNNTHAGTVCFRQLVGGCSAQTTPLISIYDHSMVLAVLVYRSCTCSQYQAYASYYTRRLHCQLCT